MSPIENALELAGKLPDSARLHLVSHSRGGLVGELLCRAMLQSRSPFDDDDLALFAAPERKRDLEALTALRKLLADKKFQIERFVRVGCPARGTTLADGRLDRYLSITVNLLGLIPGFMVTGDSKERRRLLQQMADFSKEAYDVGVAAQSSDAYYSLANRLAAEIVLAWPSSAKSPRTKAARERLDAIKSGLEQIRSIAAQTKPGTDFWADTLMGNVLLGT